METIVAMLRICPLRNPNGLRKRLSSWLSLTTSASTIPTGGSTSTTNATTDEMDPSDVSSKQFRSDVDGLRDSIEDINCSSIRPADPRISQETKCNMRGEADGMTDGSLTQADQRNTDVLTTDSTFSLFSRKAPGFGMLTPFQPCSIPQAQLRPSLTLSVPAIFIQSQATTVMIRNLERRTTLSVMLMFLDERGFIDTYDFVYLPVSPAKGTNMGFAFLNFISPMDAQILYDQWEQLSELRGCKSKKLSLVPALAQGKYANILNIAQGLNKTRFAHDEGYSREKKRWKIPQEECTIYIDGKIISLFGGNVPLPKRNTGTQRRVDDVLRTLVK